MTYTERYGVYVDSSMNDGPAAVPNGFVDATVGAVLEATRWQAMEREMTERLAILVTDTMDAYRNRPHVYGIRGRKCQRVELHPSTDRWAAGDRYGTIVSDYTRHGGADTVFMDVSRARILVTHDQYRILG